MQIIGNDETVARHSGIDNGAAEDHPVHDSGAFIGMAGAILAPRYAYVEPPAAFNPMISFLVVIMALLGGTRRLWGPLVGVIPFTILMDFVSVRFPNDTLDRHRHRVPGRSSICCRTGITGRLEACAIGSVAGPRPDRHRGARGNRGESGMSAAVLSVAGARKAFGGLVAVNDVSFDVQ